MTLEQSGKADVPQPVGARALQLRLYREIGVAAVAAALGDVIPSEATPIPLRAQHTPAILGSKSVSARPVKAA